MNKIQGGMLSQIFWLSSSSYVPDETVVITEKNRTM